MKNRQLARINLNALTSQMGSLQGRYLDLGGRGLTSRIIAGEVPPQCDPLGPENKLVVAAGLLAGTPVPNSGRLSIGAKSPLTRTIKEANAGGVVAQKLARIGIQALVFEGIAKEPVSVLVNHKGVSLISAADLKESLITDCIERLRTAYGDDIGMICIGPAGEKRLLASAVAVTTPDFYPRIAARGGLGAVMGAKNIKAVIIDDRGCTPPEIEDKALLKKSVKAFTQGIMSHPLAEGFKHFGTPMLVGLINEIGAIPTKNFSEGRFAGADKISGEAIAEMMKKRPNSDPTHRCMSSCVLRCSNVLTDAEGNVVVSGLEYETLALIGANCMIDDVDIIAQINRICNDIGLDTMEVGGALALAMEAGLLEWGDGPAALELVREISKGSERGLMIGNGCKFTGDSLEVSRIPHVKGQALAGYDPRGLKGTGVTYATSTMGADHTCGNALPSPANPKYDPMAPTGQGPVSKFLQSYFAAIDTLGLCLFASLPALDLPEVKQYLIESVAAVLDEPLDQDYLERLGQMVLQTERKFNDAVGFRSEDDRLPRFFSEEILSSNQQRFDVSDEDLDDVNPLS
jgi:aldehyde:ferredoxin oxidoreductase